MKVGDIPLHPGTLDGSCKVSSDVGAVQDPMSVRSVGFVESSLSVDTASGRYEVLIGELVATGDEFVER